MRAEVWSADPKWSRFWSPSSWEMRWVNSKWHSTQQTKWTQTFQPHRKKWRHRERGVQINQSRRKTCRKPPGSKVDSKKTFSSPPAKSKWEARNAETLSSSIKKTITWIRRHSQGSGSRERTHKAPPMLHPHHRRLRVAAGLECAFIWFDWTHFICSLAE